MGELARERGARDLWISRGHLWAAGAVVVLLCGLSFLAGVQTGRAQATAVATQKPTVAPPEGDLVELIARVEATSQPGGGVEKLTFPDALAAGNVEVRVPGEVEPADAEASSSAAAPPTAPIMSAEIVDPTPNAAFSVLVGEFNDPQAALDRKGALVEAGHEAWIGLRSVDGAMSWRVSVGSYPTEAKAQAAADAWKDGPAEPLALP